MVPLFRRYTHVPLGLVSVLLIVVVIAWLLERSVDSLWDPALRIASPIPTAVTLVPAPVTAARAAEIPAPADPEPMPVPPPLPAPPAPVELPTPAPPADRYVLESGPFLAAETADRVEDQLHELGYATVRFRKQVVRRTYRVLLSGFASPAEARRAIGELGQGIVVSGEDGPEVLLERHVTLQDAVAGARAQRARGREVRVDERVRPTVIYHIRYGQFQTHALAEARGEKLAALGVASHVVKIR